MSEPNQESQMKMAKRLIAMIPHDGSLKRLWNTFRFFMAVGTEVLLWKLMKNPQR
jgi:hypothetical protein